MIDNFTSLKGKKFAINTLGCKVNQYESDAMADSLMAAGVTMVSFQEWADIYIINTCSVTNMAERKSRQIIHRAKRINPDAILVAAGCYVQAAADKLMEDNDIDIILGNNRKKDIVRVLLEYIDDRKAQDTFIDINKTNEYESMTLVKPSEHCRAYVKVQDGCNNFCTYCIIPYTRGRIRSRRLEEVVDEVKGLASREIKEVVLTGINLSSYMDEDRDLLDLILSVGAVEGIERVRLGSLEPRIITKRFIEGIKGNDKVCPHFHLSLQSACDETLKRMNRRYTIAEYMEKCELIRSYYDRPAITTDIIVGFPGETEEEFETTVKNLEALNLYEMHIFKYSKRNGTVAASMPDQIPDGVKDKRSAVLLDMTARHKKAYEDSFKGSVCRILAEEYDTCEDDTVGILKGHTERYILIEKKMDIESCKANVNKFIEVEL